MTHPSTDEVAPKPLLILVSAPSGAGKTTLCQQLMEARPEIKRVVTCTTRPPRGREKDGEDYHFLDRDHFLREVERGAFLEHATVYDNLYGTRREDVLAPLEEGNDLLLNIDVQGAAKVRLAAGGHPVMERALVSVFLTPPSMEVLESRLRNRNADSESAIRTRLGQARREILEWRWFDYLIVSGSVQRDLNRLLSVVRAEKLKTARMDALPAPLREAREGAPLP